MDYYQDPYGIGASANALMQMPYQSPYVAPPAGITDLTQEGWSMSMQGLAHQYQPAQDYANAMYDWGNLLSGSYWDYLASGQSGWNPMMSDAAMMGQGVYGSAGSFDPYNNPALMDSVQAGVDMLQRQYDQQVLPSINANLTAAGPGAYGGSRAGVAEGIAQQGNIDAQAKMIADMLSQGYAQGIQVMPELYGQMNQAAALAGNLGLGSLGLQNAMMQNAMTAIPGLMEQQYLAGQAPGAALTELGNYMAQAGFSQQQTDQLLADYYNAQAMHAYQYPYDMMNYYTQWMNPYLQPGTTSTSIGTTSAQNPGMGPFQAAVGGAATGYALYDQFGNPQTTDTANDAVKQA